jgi:hypothetical protein
MAKVGTERVSLLSLNQLKGPVVQSAPAFNDKSAWLARLQQHNPTTEVSRSPKTESRSPETEVQIAEKQFARVTDLRNQYLRGIQA